MPVCARRTAAEPARARRRRRRRSRHRRSRSARAPSRPAARAASGGRTTRMSIASSKYHLLTRNVCSGPKRACISLGGTGLRDLDPVGERDAANAAIRAPMTVRSSRRRRVRIEAGEPSCRTSAPGSSGSTCRRRGSASTPETIVEDRERAHRDLHRHLALGDAVLGPGKPTSVSSSSPVAGLRRHLRVREVAVLELDRLGARLAPEGAEDHPERVEAGDQRADIAEDAEDLEAAAAVVQVGDDVVLREPAGERRHPRQRRGRR